MSLLQIKYLKSSSSLLCLLASSVFLYGCASTELAVHTVKKTASTFSVPANISYKVGIPYKIKGITYYPKEDYQYDETGVASWYGPNFHGKKTANGEVYNQNGMTAAHRTLPLPTVVRVTNLENGRSVKLRINDRGPYHDNRIIDLSSAAAEALDVKRKGTARVRVQIIPDESYALALAMGRKGAAPAGYSPKATAPQIQVASTKAVPNNVPIIPQKTPQTIAQTVTKPVETAVATPLSSISTQTLPSTPNTIASTVQPIDPKPMEKSKTIEEITASLAKEVAGQDAQTGVIQASYQPTTSVASISPSATSPTGGSSAETLPMNEKSAGLPQNSQNVALVAPKTYIQVGAFGDLQNAQKLQNALVNTGNVSISSISSGETMVHRVRIGPFASQEEASVAFQHIKDLGLGDARFVYD